MLHCFTSTEFMKPGADQLEHANLILSLCHGICTGWSIFSIPFLFYNKGSSKNKSVYENAVTEIYWSCMLLLRGSWWSWIKMADGHVYARLLICTVFSTFALGSRGIDKNQGHSKANAHIVLLYSWAINRQSCANRVKFPIVKWSKHGCIVITLPEIKRATS